MPRCSVIIPVYNQAGITRQCLEALLAYPVGAVDFEIIVVNDGSTDMTQTLLTEYEGRIQVLTHETNAGFATACNDGAAAAAGEFLIFLNNDTIGTAEWLDKLVSYADAHPTAAVVGSKLLFPNDTVQHAGVVICQDGYPRHIYAGFDADHPAVNKSRRFQAVTGACMLIQRAVFEKAGGLDTHYRNGYEDVDLCLRLGAQGREIHYCHESVLYHLESVSREGRHQDFEHNDRLYRERWASRIHPDDIQYYLDDGLLRLEYWEFYPFQIELSSLLGTLQADGHIRQADRLLYERSRLSFELIKDVVRLSTAAKVTAEEIRELRALLNERTAWAQRASSDAAERDQIIRDLQATLAEQTAWAQQSAEAVAERDQLIRDLQQRSEEALAERDQLQARLDRLMLPRRLLKRLRRR